MNNKLAKITVYWLFIFFFIAVAGSACKRKKTKTGFSFKGKYLKLTPATSKKASKTVAKVIATMRDYKGTPHKTGGVSRLGIDCSGLMIVGFLAIEKEIPRRAADQATMAPSINLENIQPGDMIFFSDSKIGKGITHVGMVTEVMDSGKIMFIHTSSSLGVIESNLVENYWQKTFVKAIRPGF